MPGIKSRPNPYTKTRQSLAKQKNKHELMVDRYHKGKVTPTPLKPTKKIADDEHSIVTPSDLSIEEHDNDLTKFIKTENQVAHKQTIETSEKTNNNKRELT